VICKGGAGRAAGDEAGALPGPQNSADGEQRRSGHFREVLPCDRKDDLDAPLDLAPGTFGQPQQRVRDPAFDRLGRHLHHASMGFLKAGADSLQRVGGEQRKFLDQPRPAS